MPMKLASAFSRAPNVKAAADELSAAIELRLGAGVDQLTVFATEDMCAEGEGAGLPEELALRFPGAVIFGGTSCRGVVTDEGVHFGPHVSAVLAMRDSAGACGGGHARIDGNPRAAARAALQMALEAAGHPYESPSIVWTCQPPGVEEEVLAGLADIVGPGCPIMGGSSADNAIAGAWRQFSGAGVMTDSVVVCALFLSAAHGLAFKSGYAPTGVKGKVTMAAKRQLIEIDGMPAAHTYAEWIGGAIDPDAPGMILSQSAAAPLARRIGTYAGVPEFLLSHPASVEPDGSLTLFTEIGEGEEVHVMAGSREALIERGGLVIRDARRTLHTAPAGGLVIFCGGCMLTVEDSLEAVSTSLRQAMGAAPFLTAFTFGEQGALVSSGNRHGNLMIAATVFADA
jgi:hypothetical protein